MINLTFSEVYLDYDVTSLQLLANTLVTVQQLYGVIPNITSIGPHSQAVVDMLLQARFEGKLKEVDLPPEIDQLIIMDRSVDMVSPFITPLTYEGVIDEVMNKMKWSLDYWIWLWKCNFEWTLSWESNRDFWFLTFQNSDKMITFRFHNGDSLFQEIRDNNIVTISKIIKDKVSQVKRTFFVDD